MSIDLTSYQQRNTQALTTWLEKLPMQEQALTQAMRYGLLLGGKRVRPYLVYITGQMLGMDLDELDTPACAIECIHAYSLIHDDLPAMDDDDLRRGQATCHKKFDEATAILAGDALQTLAFDILATGALAKDAQSKRIAMIQTLTKSSGAQGMCLGQALDLDAENKQISLTELEQIHRHKTGALIEAALTLGALAAGDKGEQILPALMQYAQAIGLAFQVQDDILDVTGDTQTLGKPQGSDQALNKSTYPALLGIEGAKQKAQQLLQQALEALNDIPYPTDKLAEFAYYIVERDH